MGILADMIAKSGLDFLKISDFEERTPGRFFQKQKLDCGNGLLQFFVVLGPNVKSPVHNHRGQNMAETHLLLYGSGHFEIFDDDGNIVQVLKLEKGVFHKIFSNTQTMPDHRFVAGAQGSLCLAVEMHGMLS